jgi:hypothetical protein
MTTDNDKPPRLADVEEAEAAVQRSPGDAQAWRRLANAYAEADRFGMALEAMCIGEHDVELVALERGLVALVLNAHGEAWVRLALVDHGLVQVTLPFRLAAPDAVSLVPVKLDEPDPPAWQPHHRPALHLPPAAFAVQLLERSMSRIPRLAAIVSMSVIVPTISPSMPHPATVLARSVPCRPDR